MSEESGTLWIVATPIGTLSDLAPRAADLLSSVDLILAEDTRRTRRLLSHFGISVRNRLRSLHEHNEHENVEGVLGQLKNGRQIALVSDAGTPALSDPGFLLIKEAREQGICVLSVPGPSAFTTALAASGQPPLPALLVGFLPPKSGPRQRKIASFAGNSWTLVIFLSPHRLRKELEDLRSGLGADRSATLLKELSKAHEKAVYGPLEVLVDCTECDHPRGEYVIVIGPPVEHQEIQEDLDDETIRLRFAAMLAAGAKRNDALKTIVKETGRHRREVYHLLFTSKS